MEELTTCILSKQLSTSVFHLLPPRSNIWNKPQDSLCPSNLTSYHPLPCSLCNSLNMAHLFLPQGPCMCWSLGLGCSSCSSEKSVLLHSIRSLLARCSWPRLDLTDQALSHFVSAALTSILGAVCSSSRCLLHYSVDSMRAGNMSGSLIAEFLEPRTVPGT